ncbi:carbohydrate ABC transporter permease [Gymnodinialimonas hymeniacidonis]|uniref:carbohydrate ABC transporter permease n=1 Tax=Gymnodinialimonas hymeniacidonis TaxID=3126508 RepID=UPI0034C695E4
MLGRYLLIFVLGIIGILMAAPLVLTLFTSLKPTTELVNPAWYPPLDITFEHYIRVWTEGGFSRYFLNTLLISVVDAVIMIIVASLSAYALVFMKFPGKALVQLVFLIGLMIPVTAIILPLFQVVRSVGLVNTHLGVIFADLALAVSIFVFMFQSYFVGIPKALHEAARIDGATEFQIYRRVVMPIATPAVLTTALLEFLWSWNDLLLRLLLLTEEPMRTLSVGLLNFQGVMTRDVTGLSSGTIIMAVPVIILFLSFQRHFVRGMTQGAVK